MIQIVYDGIEKTEALDNVIRTKFAKPEKFLRSEENIKIRVFCSGKINQCIEAVAVLNHTTPIVINTKSKTAYAAINDAADDMVRHLRKLKEKRIDKHRVAKDNFDNSEDIEDPENIENVS